MKTFRPDILSRLLFVFALGLLLLNDFYLKYEYANYVTGKLSDFAGLFVFPYFISSIRTKSATVTYIITAFLFLLWKSEFSQPLINWGHSIGIGIVRVVDYTDLLALIILPVSFRYFEQQVMIKRDARLALSVPLSIVTLFAIWATSLPRQQVDVNLAVNSVFELRMNKSDFFSSLEGLHNVEMERNLQDSLFYLYFDITKPGYANVAAQATITGIGVTKTNIRLDTILFGSFTGRLFRGVDEDRINAFKAITAKEFAALFEKDFIRPVQNGDTKYLYYDNKAVADLYNEKMGAAQN